MAAEHGPLPRPPERDCGDAAAAAHPPPAAPSERIGPVAIERHEKADGRALLLYTRAADPPA